MHHRARPDGDTAVTTYITPDAPADPELAALDIVVRLPASLSPQRALAIQASGLAEQLQNFRSALEAERTFRGLAWPDARAVAGVICFDVCNRGAGAAGFLRGRACNALTGEDCVTWADRAAVARAFRIASSILES